MTLYLHNLFHAAKVDLQEPTMTEGPVPIDGFHCYIHEKIELLLSARYNGPGQMRFFFCDAVADTSCRTLRAASGVEEDASRRLRGLELVVVWNRRCDAHTSPFPNG